MLASSAKFLEEALLVSRPHNQKRLRPARTPTDQKDCSSLRSCIEASPAELEHLARYRSRRPSKIASASRSTSSAAEDGPRPSRWRPPLPEPLPPGARLPPSRTRGAAGEPVLVAASAMKMTRCPAPHAIDRHLDGRESSPAAARTDGPSRTPQPSSSCHSRTTPAATRVSRAGAGRAGWRGSRPRSARRAAARSAPPRRRPARPTARPSAPAWTASASACAGRGQRLRVVGEGQQGAAAALDVEDQVAVDQHDQRARLAAGPVAGRRRGSPSPVSTTRPARAAPRRTGWPGRWRPAPARGGRRWPSASSASARSRSTAPGTANWAAPRPRRSSRGGPRRAPPAPPAPGRPRRTRRSTPSAIDRAAGDHAVPFEQQRRPGRRPAGSGRGRARAAGTSGRPPWAGRPRRRHRRAGRPGRR